jgi:23S rRNA (cytidine2498-2'-O)-methyltransferase
MTPPFSPRVGFAVSGLLALCRAGFEKEAAAELHEFAFGLGLTGFVRARPDTAFVTFETPEPVPFGDLADRCDWRSLIFARQLLPWFARVDALPERDRASPLVAAARRCGQRFAEVLLETPDSDDARQQSGFCRRFVGPLQRELDKAGVLRAGAQGLPALHVLFTDATTAWLCAALPGRAALWPMGIPRLRMLREAASRSTLKLAEALFTLLGEDERNACLRPGLRAVDLGAAPGGWTWQLAHRGLRVTAVDNGPMAPSVMATEMVEHVRADGFIWRPARPVEWMVCDMVEQPSRIAALVADWVATGRCRRTIFNLKLPMKRRLEAVEQCRAIITRRFAHEGAFELRLKHLYHDREEITGYLARKDSSA